MSNPNEPLKVDPAELQAAADQLDGHAAEFLATHQMARTRAGQASLGSGLSAAALPQMLTAWEDQSARLGQLFVTNSAGHREAATRYVKTDTDGADGIDDAGATL